MAKNDDAKNNLKAHEGTYGGFVSLIKIGSIVTAIVVAIVIYLIAS